MLRNHAPTLFARLDKTSKDEEHEGDVEFLADVADTFPALRYLGDSRGDYGDVADAVLGA